MHFSEFKNDIQELDVPKQPNPSVAELVGDWILKVFGRRQLCYVYFHYLEKGPDLPRPKEKTQPYIVYCKRKPTAQQLAPLFTAVVPKGRTIEVLAVQIQPIGRVKVV